MVMHVKLKGDNMRIFIVTGNAYQAVSENISGNIDIINGNGISLKDLESFLSDAGPEADGVLITDEALSQQACQDSQSLEMLLQYMDTRYTTGKVVFITRDFMKKTELEYLCLRYKNFEIITCDYMRIPGLFYREVFAELLKAGNSGGAADKQQLIGGELEKKKLFFDRFKPKPKSKPELKAADSLTKELESISRGISRIVAVTGHRGCGLTSTAVNLAYEASKRGLNTILIDMDIEYRSTNMYFSSFHDRTKTDEDINASLIRLLARPEGYMTTSVRINGNLWLAALGYGFKDQKLIGQFYNSGMLVRLLSVLRSKFNLVLLDMPMDLFKTFGETLIHIDIFGLCVSNNLHSILSTLRNIEAVFNSEQASYLNTKSRAVVTKYNDRSRLQGEIFVPDKVSEVLSSGLSESFRYEMKVAGYVPYAGDFDTQIETDVPLVSSNAEHERAYGNILLRLMEGSK